MRGHRDLTRASVAAVACALVAALVPLELLRLIAALPLTVFLPGFAIVEAAFGEGEPALPKRLTLSVGTSLIVLVLGTLILNVFPFGLTTASGPFPLPLIVIAACRWAAMKRKRRGEVRPLSAFVARPSARTAILVGAAILIGAASIALAQKPLPAKNAEGFTVLWMLPTDAREEAVGVGVESNKQDPAAYRLEVQVGGESQSREYRVKLDPGEEKTFEVAVPSKPGRRTHVVASLYRKSEPQLLYRRVTR